MSTPIIRLHFKSASNYLNWIAHTAPVWRCSKHIHSSHYCQNQEYNTWAGTADFDEAWRLAKYGWSEGKRLLQSNVQIADKMIVSDVRKPAPQVIKTHSVAGAYPNVQLAIAGSPRHMVHTRREIIPTPVIQIVYNNNYASKEDLGRVMKWGGALCSYVGALEDNGLPVSLMRKTEGVPMAGPDTGPHLSISFPVKSPRSPLDMQSLAFWWAHPSALRRIDFAGMERLDIEYFYSPSYGQPHNVTKPEPSAIFLDFSMATDSMAENLQIIRQAHMMAMAHRRYPSEKECTVVNTMEFRSS